MNFQRTEIPDVVVCEPKIFGDNRGYFVESFRADLLDNFLGFGINFCQDNESQSSKGVLRGLHYQLAPFAQTKLVRVVKGKVIDIAIDIRKGSPYFGKYVAVELNSENKRQLLIPRGFAHGFVVLEENTIFAYKVDNYYSKECDRGIAYNDPTINIDWQKLVGDISNLNLSEKDKNQPKLLDAELFDFGVNYYA